ncbi:MAG: DMT family transporter [Bacteroidales bacterium]|nr:DMT family transporter [Bacteroidales bacterium]
MKLKPLYTYIIVTLSMIFWGMSFVWSKIVLDYYEPITTVLIRLILSSILLFAGLLLFRRLKKIDASDLKLFLLSALFNPFLYFLGENYGLKFSSPTVTAVIIATIPLFTPVVAFFVFREKLSLLNIFGLVVSFFGVLFMLVGDDYSLGVSPVGMAWLSLAVLTAVFYSVLLKKLAMKYDPFLIIAYQNFFGAIYFLPIFFIFDFSHFITVRPTAELISSLLLLAFFASSLAYVFFTISSRELGISKTNLFTNLIPVFTAIFSFLILGEVFEMKKILGMLVVITGVLMSQMDRGNMMVNFYRFILFRKKNSN